MSSRPFIAFNSDDEIAAIGVGLLDLSLPKPRWTHAAHFAAALWLISCRQDLDASRDMPGFIRAYNEATGVANTDTEGYHETITQASLRAARSFESQSQRDGDGIDLGQEAADYRRLTGNLRRDAQCQLPGGLDVGVAAQANDNGDRPGRVSRVQIDRDLAGGDGVGQNDQMSIRRAQRGVAQGNQLHDSDVRAGRSGDLQRIAQAKREINRDGYARHEIAESALSRETDDHGHHPCAGQQGRAHGADDRKEVWVKNEHD